LELAAKAAGIKIPKPNPWFTYDEAYGFMWMNMDGRAVEKKWNPLADDGDAFRLAVRLRMIVTPGTARLLDGRVFGKDMDSIEETRRAIVRAAAEIGRNIDV
jgi:hypothetical protein